MNEREYWLDGYKGPCKGGYFFRSAIAKEIHEFEERTGRHVVAIKLEKKESGRPSFNIEFVLEVTAEDVQEELKKQEEEGADNGEIS